MPERIPLRWRAISCVIWWIVWRTCRRHLLIREIRLATGENVRWLAPDCDGFRDTLADEIETLRADGHPARELTGGSRLMAELALFTVAADLAFRRAGVAADCSRDIVADIGWDLYRRMLLLTSLPIRLVTRDPGRRLRWTLGVLLFFPFRPVGAPGYAADLGWESGQVRTHFTCCPPQSLARRVSVQRGDRNVLEAFRQSWCRYDWVGADLIAGDTRRGHYSRSHTLSGGDTVCDMCWAAGATGDPRHPRRIGKDTRDTE